MTQPAQPPAAISVVIPARRAGATIGRQLAALARQRIDVPWDVIVVQTDPEPLPEGPRPERVRVIFDAEGRGPGRARNLGVAATEAELIAFCDADDEVTDGWLAALRDGLADHAVVAGAATYDELNSRQQLEDYGYPPDRPVPGAPPVERGFLPFGETYSLGVRRAAFEAVGGFDEALRCAEDVDLTFRLQERGDALGYAPAALIHRQLRTTRRAQAMQMMRWGIGDAALYRRHRAAGMPPAGRHGGVWAWARLVRDVPQLASRRRRGRWLQHAGTRVGLLVGSVRARVWYL